MTHYILTQKPNTINVFMSYINNEEKPFINKEKTIAVLTKNLSSCEHIISMYNKYGSECISFLTENFILFDKKTQTILAFTAPNSPPHFYGITVTDSFWISTKLLDKNQRKTYKILSQNSSFIKTILQEPKITKCKRIRISEETKHKKMGNLLNALKGLFGNEERRILMLGIDGAGKTTILYKLKMGENINTVPTIGFNVESLQFRNIKFTVWDVGGQDRIRKLWRHYYEGTNGLIYVVDSNDVNRIEESSLELEKLLREDEMRNAVLLILANKQDLPNAVSVSELTERLGLHRLRDRAWNVQATCAMSGDGLHEGMEWLATSIKNSRK